MALINCRECGKEISDSAASCPHCGCPSAQVNIQTNTQRLEAYNNYGNQKKKHSTLSVWALVLSLFGCTAIVAFVLALVDLCINDKTKKHLGSWFALVFTGLYLFVFFILPSNDEANTSSIENSNQTIIESSSSEEIDIIEYTSCNVDDMMDLLSSNALKAEKTYQDKYLEVTGRVGAIDSDGSYISIYPIKNEYAFIGVQCYIKNDEQLNYVLDLKTGDNVTVRIKCTTIGEIIGYSGDIIEFVK